MHPLQPKATHLLVSVLPVAAAGLVGLRCRALTAGSSGLGEAPVAARGVAGASCHMPALAHVGGVAVAGGVVLVLAVVAARIHSCRHNRRTAVPAPICPAGHSSHHSTRRSCPGHGRSRSTAGRSVDHTGCRTRRVADTADAAGPVAGVPGRSAAVVAAAGTGRSAVAGMPWRRSLRQLRTRR